MLIRYYEETTEELTDNAIDKMGEAVKQIEADVIELKKRRKHLQDNMANGWSREAADATINDLYEVFKKHNIVPYQVATELLDYMKLLLKLRAESNQIDLH